MFLVAFLSLIIKGNMFFNVTIELYKAERWRNEFLVGLSFTVIVLALWCKSNFSVPLKICFEAESSIWYLNPVKRSVD